MLILCKQLILSKNYLREILKFVVTINSNKIDVELIKKKNIKHCYLRILKKDFIQIKANNYFTLNDAKELLKNKESWLKKNILKFDQNKLLEKEFYFLGEVETIFEDDFNIVEYYKECSKEYIPPIVEEYSKKMQLFPKDLKFRNNKSRWGSCSFHNVINLNINLMRFPKEVIEYIVIHELAHIKHKNHSKDFWSEVEKFCPFYKQRHKDLLLFNN